MHTCSAIGFALMVCHRRLILKVLDHYSTKHQTRFEMLGMKICKMGIGLISLGMT